MNEQGAFGLCDLCSGDGDRDTGVLAQPLCHCPGVHSPLDDIHVWEDDHRPLISLIIKIRLFFQRKLWKLFAKIVSKVVKGGSAAHSVSKIQCFSSNLRFWF